MTGAHCFATASSVEPFNVRDWLRGAAPAALPQTAYRSTTDERGICCLYRASPLWPERAGSRLLPLCPAALFGCSSLALVWCTTPTLESARPASMRVRAPLAASAAVCAARGGPSVALGRS
eukprot:5217698-Pleurochrysis_carterae.AAC.2